MRISFVLCFISSLGLATACASNSDGDTASDAQPRADAPPPLTWTSYADQFFTNFCHPCHGPGDGLRDYSQLSVVRAEASSIRCGVSATTLSGCTIPARQFPIGSGPKPTDEERALLVRWLDEGALE